MPWARVNSQPRVPTLYIAGGPALLSSSGKIRRIDLHGFQEQAIMKATLLAAVLLIGGVAPVYAQSDSISGQVVVDSSSPASEVFVTLEYKP